MNLSFNAKLTLKMTALSVIFFVLPTACTVDAHSQNESERYVNNISSDKTIKLLDSRIEMRSSPIIIAGSPNEGLMRCETEPNIFHKSFLLKNERSLETYYQYKTSPIAQEIFNIVKVPESGPEWVSIAVSIIALISSFGVPYWLHRKARKESINEGYWVREVIMPKINELAFDVTAEFKKAIPSSQDVFLDLLHSKLFPKLGELRDSLYLFNGFKSLKNDVEILDEICDNLEGRVSDNIDKSDEVRIFDISDFHLTLIAKLIDIHRKIG